MSRDEEVQRLAREAAAAIRAADLDALAAVNAEVEQKLIEEDLRVLHRDLERFESGVAPATGKQPR